MTSVIPEVPVRGSVITRVQVPIAVAIARTLHRKPPQTLRRLTQRISQGARPATYDQAKRARDEVLTYSALCRGNKACLTRSIAVALLCRLRGHWPTWAVGVVTIPPFAAHAWVEAEDQIVDEPLTREDFRSFFKVAAEARRGNRLVDNTNPNSREV